MINNSNQIFQKSLSTGYNNKGTMGSTLANTKESTAKQLEMTANEKLANESSLRGEIHSMEVGFE
jgi:hypothetical protein